MSTVIIKPLVSECRIYYKDNASSKDDYQLGMNIIWIPSEPGAVFLSMHVAEKPHTRKTLKALIKALLELDIHTVYAVRAGKHVLPRAVQLADGTWKLDLLQFKKLFENT